MSYREIRIQRIGNPEDKTFGAFESPKSRNPERDCGHIRGGHVDQEIAMGAKGY
jgi:hypothetical protein